ncbi:MAG TPA: NUDIX hydrolase [Ktedonobacterales bacterium]|nr:NUDIX hydrolase [Ktedonobacterales bacterium]
MSDSDQHLSPQWPDAEGSLWRTLSAREVYRNPWLSVTEYQVVRPDGSAGIYGVVDPGDNVTVVALDADADVWIIEDFIYPIQRRGWFLPTGAIERGEDPLLAAQRELVEETGLRAETWDLLGAFYLTPGIATQRSYLYLARGLTVGEPQREPTEAGMTMRRMPLRAALDASRRGETPSAVTALGLALAWEVTQSVEA